MTFLFSKSYLFQLYIITMKEAEVNITRKEIFI